MKNGLYGIFLLVFSLLFLSPAVNAQTATGTIAPMKTSRVAIFSPLYLDSVFTGVEYKYGKNYPRFTGPGLEFVNGALLALDSMKVYGGNIFATVYDSKSMTDPIQSLIDRHLLDSVNLIIGNVRDEEYGLLANFSARNRIPFISATYPNDGGIVNPFLIILNSTLRAHCEAIFSHLLQTATNKNIFFIRKNGEQEDAIFKFFEEINNADGKRLLSYHVINTEKDKVFTLLDENIDTLKENVIIGASLNRDFAEELIVKSAELTEDGAKVTLIGMPNWDGFKDFAKKEAKDFPYYYTSTYYNNETNGPSMMMQDVYRKKFNNNPSELAYRGYETTFIFSRLLARFPDDFMNHLNDYAYKVFTEYTILPVLPRGANPAMPQYFENKRLYFMEVRNGYINKTWK